MKKKQQNRSKVGRVLRQHQRRVHGGDWLRVNYTLARDYSNDERLEGCPISSSDVCFAGTVIEAAGELPDRITICRPRPSTLNRNIAGTVTLGQT